MPNKTVKRISRKVGQYDLEDNLIKIYNTVTEARKDNPGVTHCLSGRNKQSKGYKYKYID